MVNAAGCGAMLKQYAHLLHDEPEWADRARRISERTRDVSEALAATGPVRGTLAGTRSGTGFSALRVTHDPPCHQMHAQRIVAQPLQVLAPSKAWICAARRCRSALRVGRYLQSVEPGTSDAVLHPKLQRIAETHASVLATGNPGA